MSPVMTMIAMVTMKRGVIVTARKESARLETLTASDQMRRSVAPMVHHDQKSQDAPNDPPTQNHHGANPAMTTTTDVASTTMTSRAAAATTRHAATTEIAVPQKKRTRKSAVADLNATVTMKNITLAMNIAVPRIVTPTSVALTTTVDLNLNTMTSVITRASLASVVPTERTRVFPLAGA